MRSRGRHRLWKHWTNWASAEMFTLRGPQVNITPSCMKEVFGFDIDSIGHRVTGDPRP